MSSIFGSKKFRYPDDVYLHEQVLIIAHLENFIGEQPGFERVKGRALNSQTLSQQTTFYIILAKYLTLNNNESDRNEA